jgi:hypothetical protein
LLDHVQSVVVIIVVILCGCIFFFPGLIQSWSAFNFVASKSISGLPYTPHQPLCSVVFFLPGSWSSVQLLELVTN